MIDIIKKKIWNLLEKKDVSLAMLYNKDGDILWHKGRGIVGRNVTGGEGFPKSHILETLDNPQPIEEENVLVSSIEKGLPISAALLKVKAIMIQPVSDFLYLYVDSGTRGAFSDTDREIFKLIGEFLGELVDQIRDNEIKGGGITGSSDEMEKIRQLVLKYSLEDEPVLILGETGTGKSHMAELIHKFSGRKGKFLTVNTPSIPEGLFEREFFGHTKGTFTDAKFDKKGYVDEADGGTLFLDEISEVPSGFQAKLLRFIETKKYMVLGESNEKEANVRIVAASNKNLQEAIKEKEFREDLYFRLQVLEVEIPPLRKRKSDLKLLVNELQHLLKGKKAGAGFWKAMENHDWPGNVRELITVLTRAGILLESPVTGDNIRDLINQTRYKSELEKKEGKIDETWNRINNGESFWDVVKTPFLDRDLNREEVKEIIKKGLDRAGNKYKNLLPLLNLKESEYKKFMKFLNGNRLSI